MPATTRSSTKQAHIDNPNETKAAINTTSEKNPSPPGPPTKKRKTQPKETPAPKPKPSTQKSNSPQKASEDRPSDEEDSILINRAPVLDLWAATVTSTIYPSLSWQTCLSAGSAISTLCAISKGRAIGAIDPPDPGKKRERVENDELDELEVMGFHLKLQDGQVSVGGKMKKGNEGALEKKFGAEAYERAKAVFREVLVEWKGRGDELNQRAFHFYEDFRPTVPKGQKGWGRKGMLNLQAVREAVASG